MNEDRVLASSHGQFVLRKWDGTNRSGMEPVCDKVLVLVDPAVQKTRGGIIMTDANVETQTLASTTGILVSVGPQAFVYDSERIVRWEGERPPAGTRVYFERYAGQEYTSVDGKMYRIMKDRQIGGMQVPVEAAT